MMKRVFVFLTLLNRHLEADRVFLAFLCGAYDEEEIAEGDVRNGLTFPPTLAPVKIGVFRFQETEMKCGEDYTSCLSIITGI